MSEPTFPISSKVKKQEQTFQNYPTIHTMPIGYTKLLFLKYNSTNQQVNSNSIMMYLVKRIKFRYTPNHFSLHFNYILQLLCIWLFNINNINFLRVI